jgi:tetratricopeptide (TPR) repeat protein
VGRFLGEDRCLVALGRARTLAATDQEAAVQVLIDAVGEAAALDGFVDGATTVYRSFDSYASRVLYNRARRGAGDPQRAAADADKRVELVPDSYYLCHLEITQLLEHSFERTEEALRFGQRAIEIGPATAAGYRQLGRAYMLVGDMENAASVLQEGLLVAVQPSDIAMAYYQLAYVLWKAGRPQAGAVCYVKSLMTSSSMALQATAELQELVEETGVPLPAREAVDEELAAHAVPVAPTTEVIEALGSAAAAATDAGLFPVARNLLALRLRYRPDDALVNVLRSLGE